MKFQRLVFMLNRREQQFPSGRGDKFLSLAIIIALTSALFTQGCSTQQPAVVDQSLLAQAATYTLQEAVYFSTIISTCAALGGDVEVQAISKQQDWLNENTQLVLAADQIYSQHHAKNTFEHEGKTFAPEAVKLALNAKQRATDELALHKRTPENKVKTCEFRLGKLTGEPLNLSQAAKVAPHLPEILRHLPLDQHLDNVPTLANGITEVAPGKTYYQLVRNHKANCSTDPSTLVIVNQWPKEIYAHFCSNELVDVLTCEWGKCETKKL